MTRKDHHEIDNASNERVRTLTRMLKRIVSRSALIKYSVLIIMLIMVSPNVSATFTPNDTHWPQWGPMRIDADDAWDLSRAQNDGIGDGFTNPGKREIKVAILDSGVDVDHEDLEDNFWHADSEDFYEGDTNVGTFEHHGTHVAGTIAAVQHNNLGITGMATVRLVVYKVSDNNGGGNRNTYIQATQDAFEEAVIDNIDIVSWSMGCYGNAADWIWVDNAIQQAWNNNILIVRSGGNWVDFEHDTQLPGQPGHGSRQYFECAFVPNCALGDHILSVAMSDDLNHRHPFSLYGNHIDLMAPGEDIMSCEGFNGYGTRTGTSMATPHVSGVAALIMSYRPDLTNAQVSQIIVDSCDDVIDAGDDGPEGESPGIGRDQWTGWGMVNAEKALRLANSMKTQWSNPHTQSSIRTFIDEYDCLASDIDRHGYTHVVFIDDRTGSDQVFYRRLDATGTVIHNDIQISNSAFDCSNPDIEVDRDMNVHIVWKESDNTPGAQFSKVWYAKWQNDMVQALLPPNFIWVAGSHTYFRTIRVVTEIDAPQGTPDAYVFFDEYVIDQEWDINYIVVDSTGSSGNPVPFAASADSDGRGPFGFDVDVSYVDDEMRIHVAYHRADGDDMDIMYWSMNKDDTNRYPNQNNPRVIAQTNDGEIHPSIDAQFENGRVHIVFERWSDWYDDPGDGDEEPSRDGQRIMYCSLDSDGDMMLLPAQVGFNVDHEAIDARGMNGKFYPSVAYAINDVVTIAWREWVDDYAGGSNGYFGALFAQYHVNEQRWSIPDNPFSVHPLDQEGTLEHILVRDLNWGTKISNEHYIVNAVDYRFSENDYYQDGHITILFQEEIGVWNFKWGLLSTREYWSSISNIGSDDDAKYDPDIDVDDMNGDQHLVWTEDDGQWSTIFYRPSWLGMNLRVSNEDQPGTPEDENTKAINPRIVTNVELRETGYGPDLRVIAYIFWTDFTDNHLGETWYAAIDASLWHLGYPNYLVAPTPGVPIRVPWLINQGPAPVFGYSEHEIAFDEPNQLIHAVYTVFSLVGMGTSIHHASMDAGPAGGQTIHHDSVIINGWPLYGQPSIDIGLNGRPYVVYVDYNGATSDVYYDFLIESTNPLNPLTMEANDPQKVDDGLPGEPAVNSGQPDIRVDRPIERNDNTVFTGTRNYFVHIIWTQEDEPGRYSLQYAKYHPLDANIDNPDVPEIIQRSLLPDGYALPVDIVDPELEITDNNYLTVIYAAMTRGYQEDPLDCHLFYTLVDNNGVVSTMNTIIFEATWVVRGAYNSASALNHEGELYCAWDQGDPTVQGGNFQNTIWQRDNSH